jgi:CDP-diacylglycerol--serine O-phosphatidyltransferase
MEQDPVNSPDPRPADAATGNALVDEALTLIDDHEEVVSEGGRSFRRRGVYLLPNALTTGAMFAGFYAVIAGMGGDFGSACIAIVVAMFCDGLDGRVARLMKAQSKFGAEYDSLSDMVAFGVAPGLICFSWALSQLGRLGWTAAFIYVACAALRLARFNVISGSTDRRFFVGLASPSAAGLVVFMVWSFTEYQVEVTPVVAIFAAVVTVLAGVLMVLNVRYYSFKDIDFHNPVPFVSILAFVLILVVVAWHTATVLFTMAVLYALSGPLIAILKRRKKPVPPLPVVSAANEPGADR